MKKKIISFTIVLAMILCISVCAYADSTASSARNGVAVVATIAQVNAEYIELWSTGSCFFIGKTAENPQYLLTNYHVVETYLEYGKGELVSTGEGVLKMILRVYFSSSDYAEAYLIAYDESQDVALLKLASPTDKRSALKLQVPDDSLVGSQIYTIGYPGFSDNMLIDPTTIWGMSDSLITKGTVGRLVITSGAGTQWIQIADTNWSAGNSGGPLVTEKGTVVGMCCGGYSQNDSKMSVGVNIESVIPMLNNNGVAFDRVGAGIPVWVFYAIGAAVLVALVVLLIVLLVVKSKKKKAKKSAPVPPPQKRAYVRSLSSQHGGVRVPVGPQGILIGRSPRCAIVFRDNTPGISREHCSIRWDESTGEFVLEDTKSSYGTFLMTGQKLTPYVQYRLRNGDSFYLADMSNMMRLEVE